MSRALETRVLACGGSVFVRCVRYERGWLLQLDSVSNEWLWELAGRGPKPASAMWSCTNCQLENRSQASLQERWSNSLEIALESAARWRVDARAPPPCSLLQDKTSTLFSTASRRESFVLCHIEERSPSRL